MSSETCLKLGEVKARLKLNTFKTSPVVRLNMRNACMHKPDVMLNQYSSVHHMVSVWYGIYTYGIYIRTPFCIVQ